MQFTGLHEVRPSWQPRPQVSHVVFDFDGTVSWLRHGWPGIMCDVFRERLTLAPGETDAALRGELLRMLLALNGKPTIMQMIQFADYAAARGLPGIEPQAVCDEYQRRLDEAIDRRTRQVRENPACRDDYLIYGLRPVLEHVAVRGLTPVILSSTIQERVREEAGILDVARFFGPHIYGGTGDPRKFSKRMVYDSILAMDNTTGDRLLSIGDGPVEIAIAKELGGLAIGLCSDEEHNGSGNFDLPKQRQLLDAGADVVVPDYRDVIGLIDEMLGR